MIDENTLDILLCPNCRKRIELTDTKDKLVCKSCDLQFPIVDDIPVMILSEAKHKDTGG